MVNLAKIHNFELEPRQKQIIIGTILGGSSIIKPTKGKHCYLSMRDKNTKWLEYKANELKNLATAEPFTLEKTNRWHSCCYPIFDEMRSRFYKKNKRCMNIDVLSGLWDVGLMVWMCDASRMINGSIVINTHIWGQKGTKAIMEYFELALIGDSEMVKDRGYFRVKLTKPSTIKLLKNIEHQIPHFMVGLQK